MWMKKLKAYVEKFGDAFIILLGPLSVYGVALLNLSSGELAAGVFYFLLATISLFIAIRNWPED